jgi:hypothetical protein
MTYVVACCFVAEEGRSPKISFLLFCSFYFWAFGLLFSNFKVITAVYKADQFSVGATEIHAMQSAKISKLAFIYHLFGGSLWEGGGAMLYMIISPRAEHACKSANTILVYMYML